MLEELKLAISDRGEDEVHLLLSDLVVEKFSRVADDINSGGFESQLEFLVGRSRQLQEQLLRKITGR